MRIDALSQSSSSIQQNSTTTERSANFSKTLTDIQTGNNRELKDFLTRLDTISSKLVNSLSIKDLEEFRNTVKSFLRSTFGQSSKIQEESFWDTYGRPKTLAHVTKINKALDDLGNQFINNNPRPLDLLSQIDQIRGLILDLFA